MTIITTSVDLLSGLDTLVADINRDGVVLAGLRAFAALYPVPREAVSTKMPSAPFLVTRAPTVLFQDIRSLSGGAIAILSISIVAAVHLIVGKCNSKSATQLQRKERPRCNFL